MYGLKKHGITSSICVSITISISIISTSISTYTLVLVLVHVHQYIISTNVHYNHLKGIGLLCEVPFLGGSALLLF